ncbi:TIGR03016 family PEP-CTERM system-associated outer membrane protein [Lentisalinibacter salinarum]|uniref:TIGR03016 family PEP-CTERM system-associated outer membrane protein n=1 Tax=Lentisalinibacter salinarum TaxID=2992239 RepID=UPI003863CBCE
MRLSKVITGETMAITVTKAAEYGMRRRLCWLALAALLPVSPVLQALELEPRITIGITRTDNVALATEDEQSETVYRAEPGFSLSHDTQRITFDADYLMQAFRYADLGESEIFHQYDASVRAALVPEIFFVEVGGDRTQSILDPEQRIPQSNLPISGNRTDRDQYYVTPSFQYVFGGTVTAQGQYRNSWVNFGESDSVGLERDSEDRTATFSLDNYRRGGGITWALRYNWERTDYDESIPFEYQQASVELGFWLSGTTRVFASGGQESAWDMPLDPALEDTFWEAGFSHQVGERLSAEFAAGERSFGSSWRGRLEFEFPRGSTTFSYSESPTTENRTRFRVPRFDDALDLQDFLSRPGSADRFIRKRLEWRFDYGLTRTDFSLGVFNDERSDRTTAAGDPLEDEDQSGINVRVGYRLGAKTTLGASGSWAERQFGEGDDSELIRAAVTADYRLGAKTTLSLEYEYAEEDGEAGGGGPFSRDYVANTVSLLLTRTF